MILELCQFHLGRGDLFTILIYHEIVAAFVSKANVFDERITEVFVSGTEAYITHTFSNPTGGNPLFNLLCSRTAKHREAAPRRHRNY